VRQLRHPYDLPLHFLRFPYSDVKRASAKEMSVNLYVVTKKCGGYAYGERERDISDIC
jgi:hypothetical protein